MRIPKSKKQDRLKAAFDLEKTICRIIASWTLFAALTLYRKNGTFSELAFAQDTSFAGMLGIVLVFFVALTAAAVFLNQFETDTWFLFFAATVCVVHWLRTYNNSENNMLFVLAVLVVYSLFLFYCIRRNELLLDRLNPGKRTTAIFAVLCGIVCCTVIAVITCLRYKTFSAPNYDFGLFCNMFHYMKNTGLPLVTSERDTLLSHFAVHISPAFYLLLPFYFIFPSPLTLQIGQAAVLASGIVPVLLLARHFKLTGRLTMIVCLIYALHPAISCGCFYDIHENFFLTPMLLWTFYFFEREKTVPMYLAAVGVLMVKEDAAIYIILFGLYAILGRKKYIHGAVLMTGALVYFFIATYLINAFGTGVLTNRFDNLIYDAEDGLFGMVKTALFNPGYLLTQLFSTGGVQMDGFFFEQSTWAKFAYFLQMFLPLGMLPFCTRRLSGLLLLAPIVVMNMLTTYKYLYCMSFQYNFGVTAFLLYAMVINISELAVPARRKLMVFGAAACCCMYITMVLPKWDMYVNSWQTGKEKFRQMEEILNTLPADASLNVSSMLLAHVADRDEVYETAYHDNKPDVDYVVLDARYDVSEVREAYLAQGYQVREEHEGMILILERGAD